MTKAKRGPDNRDAVPDSRWRRTCRRIDWVLIGLLIGIAAFHVATMPGMFYPGDNFAPRAEVADLLATGSWGIDYSYRQQFGGFLQERGQYLFENDARQKFFSKYGVGYSLLYVPPLLAEKLYAGKIAPMVGTRSQMFILNIYQIILSLVIAFYVYRLAGLYTKRRWLCAAFVLANFYGTFMWHYLRAPTLEIFQLFPFVGAYYHLLRFMRARTNDDDSRGMWMHLAASMAWGGLLFLVKLSFGPFLALIWLFAVFAGPRERSLISRVKVAVLKDYWRFALCLLVPSLIVGSVFLATNYYRCGSIMEDGYGQWVKNGKVVARLSATCIPRSLKGMFLQPHNGYNVFVLYPLFLLGLAGMPMFARRYRVEFALLLLVAISNWLIVACFHNWVGAWCYAPRYLLIPLLLCAFPAISFVEWLLRTRWLTAKIGVFVATLAILLWSFQMQWHVNSLHYFTWYYVTPFFQQFKIEQIDNYLKSSIHRGYLHRDLARYVRKKGEFYPITVLKERIHPNQRGVLPRIDAQLKQMARPNFYFHW